MARHYNAHYNDFGIFEKMKDKTFISDLYILEFFTSNATEAENVRKIAPNFGLNTSHFSPFPLTYNGNLQVTVFKSKTAAGYKSQSNKIYISV